jgi:WXG100 family type VII secretion target
MSEIAVGMLKWKICILNLLLWMIPSRKETEREFHMADQVGASSGEMQAAENNFKQRVQEFEQASQNVQSAVSQLQSSWKGGGYQSFEQAMAKWKQDMTSVSQDLQALSDAVHQADAAFQDMDQQIAKAFRGFH